MQKIQITSSDNKRFFNEIEGQNPRALYEGRDFMIITEGQERASLARIELFMHHFLTSLGLSVQERYDLVKNTNSLFESHGYSFQKQPLFSVMVEGNPIEVPAHTIIHSVLDSMMSEDAETLATISLPTNFSPKEFENYLTSLAECQKIYSYEEWLKTQAVANRILYEESLFPHTLTNCPGRQNTLKELKQILHAFKYDVDPVFASDHLSSYLTDYLKISLKTKSMDEICENLKTVKEDLRQYSISLSFNFPIPEANLIKLEDAIPNVTSLYIPIRQTSIFPSVWQHTLRRLHLTSASYQPTIVIPENRLANLTALSLYGVALSDYSVLDNRQQLQELTLSNIDISKVPTGCFSLHRFVADNCPIKDFSALNNLPHLQYCSFSNLEFLVSAPTGCLNLTSFTATSCPIRDFSGLNNLPKLEYLRFTSMEHLIQLPTGCPLLNSIAIIDCSSVETIDELNNLKNLESYEFYSLPLITRVPTGCPNLNKVVINNCPMLENFSGLDHLPKLTSCSLENLPRLTAVPSNCPKLKFFSGINCPVLTNPSGLNDCHKLHYVNLSGTPIYEWQPDYKKIYTKSIFPEQQQEDREAIGSLISRLSKESSLPQLYYSYLPVRMTPELNRYFLSLTGGEHTKLSKRDFIDKLEGILETINTITV